jgi:heme-degrading monooxygenase HmoA
MVGVSPRSRPDPSRLAEPLAARRRTLVDPPNQGGLAMSVLMTLRARGNADELERRAAANPEGMRALVDKAKEHGLIAHRFYGSEDGQLLVVDEWPDPQSFQRFFESASSEIEPMMREIGVTEEPEITFWRLLDSHDAYGWE